MRSDVRHWEDLSKKEAAAIFDDYVAGHPDRVRRAVAHLEQVGDLDPRDLDFGRASLEAIWPPVLRSAPDLPAAPEEDLTRDAVPYWAAFRLSYAQRIGRARVELATLVAAYFAECALRADPGNHWVVGDVKNQEGFRKPLLEFAGGARVSVDDLVAKTLVRALDEDGMYAEQDAAPSGLRRHFDLRMKIDPETPLDVWTGPAVADGPADDRAPEDLGGGQDVFEVHDEGGGSFHVTVDLEVDDEVSQRIDSLIDRLSASDGIARVVREDRDVFLVTATSRDYDSISAMLAGAWQADH